MKALKSRIKLPDMALGSFEAAAILGTHWTQPARMAGRGVISQRTFKSSAGAKATHTFAVYSLSECEADYLDYATKQASAGGRPRTSLDARPGMLKILAAEPHRILFGDAVGTLEAAEILRVHWTFVARLAREGKIVGRMLYNARVPRSRLWIFSRASCEANATLAMRLQASGTKRGRKRRA